MIQLITVIASILLGMIIYPILMNKYRSFISNQYQKINGREVEKENKNIQKKDEKPSFVGESKFKVGHSQTKAATDLGIEKSVEKASIFAPPIADSDPEILDVDIPLEKAELLSEEEFNSEEEAEVLEAEHGAVVASGASFEDLMTLQEVIPKEEPSQEEQQEAGRILYENQPTDMFEQLATSDEQTFEKINSLIRFHLLKHEDENQTGRSNKKQKNSLGFENFDPSSIF